MTIAEIILKEIVDGNKKRTHRILNQCIECGTIAELRESNNGKILLFCPRCKRNIGQLGGKNWNSKVKKANGETKLKVNSTISLKTLQTMDYKKYLNTGHWKRRRIAYYSKHKKICFCCGGESYVLHHICYARRGQELDKDLTPMCEECHSEVHNLVLNEDDIKLKDAHIAYKQLLGLKL